MVFNPMILDASARDVFSCLTDEQKVDVLLYALQKLGRESHLRNVVENAVQSCLQISANPIHVAKARVVRAKLRLAAGSSFGAEQDLQAALVADPNEPEANALVQQRVLSQVKPQHPWGSGTERFSNEVWKEIASSLPRCDLRSLLFVSRVPSSIASQLLFRKIDLHFRHTPDETLLPGTPNQNDPADDAVYARRSADILTRMILDSSFASLVRWLRIFAAGQDKAGSVAFQAGILANAVPKMAHLWRVSCIASNDNLHLLLRALLPASPHLRTLSLTSTDRLEDRDLPVFKNLTELSYESAAGGNQGQVHSLIAHNHASLRHVRLKNQFWAFPSNIIPVRNLTHLDFFGHFADVQVLVDIFANGHQLEVLGINCVLECIPSSRLRAVHSPLPFLRHFAFEVFDVHPHVTDRDLFPALSEFTRNRPHLKSLRFIVSNSEVQSRVGFDASVWGVLPSLVNLTNLAISYPKDLAPGLASWLIPRTVRMLHLNPVSFPWRDPSSFLTQLRPGIPPCLQFVHLADFPLSAGTLPTVVLAGFPMVRLIRVRDAFWTVSRTDDGGITDLEPWPWNRVRYHATEWLEWLGCEDIFGDKML